MMTFKTVTYTFLIAAIALGCNSEVKKADSEHDANPAAPSGEHVANKTDMPVAAAQDTTGTGSRVADTSGIKPNSAIGEGAHGIGVPNGTGTEPKKQDTGTKRGKWPTQGDPFS